MKKNDLIDARSKNIEELLKIVQEKRFTLAKYFAEVKAGKEKNTSKIRRTRRDIAQILTIIREKRLAEADKKNTEEKDLLPADKV